MNTWKQGDIYNPGAVVEHQGQAYRKSNDYDQTMPDDRAGGWELLQNSNLQQFSAIKASFSSYEARKAKHQADVRKKLAAAGLDEADVKAVLSA